MITTQLHLLCANKAQCKPITPHNNSSMSASVNWKQLSQVIKGNLSRKIQILIGNFFFPLNVQIDTILWLRKYIGLKKIEFLFIGTVKTSMLCVQTLQK